MSKFEFKNGEEVQLARKLGFVVRPASAEQNTGSVRMHVKFDHKGGAYITTTVPDTPAALASFRESIQLQARLNMALAELKTNKQRDEDARTAELKAVARPTS